MLGLAETFLQLDQEGDVVGNRVEVKKASGGFEVVVMGDFNGLCSEEAPNRNGHQLLHLVEAARMSFGN